MTAGRFDMRTIAKMKVALERACHALRARDEHAARRYIASKILACARQGGTTLSALTEARRVAASEMSLTQENREQYEAKAIFCLLNYCPPEEYPERGKPAAQE